MTVQGIRSTIMLLALSCACGARAIPNAPATPAPHFAGRVMHGDGSPAPDALVVISDPVKGAVLETTRSRQDGSFDTTLEPARYALTATDDNESVYVPALDGRSGRVEVRLETSCHRLAGRIRTGSRLPDDAIVRLVRNSDVIGDTFGAVVAADGTFRACLPSAIYNVEAPSGFATRITSVSVPSPREVVYRTEPLKDANRVPSDMSGVAPESAAAFVAAFPASTRVLGLGETNHGTREFYDERTALVTTLATKHAVRLLMIEAGYGEVVALDDYVNGEKVDIARAVQELGYWTWDTNTFLQSLAQIRNYNAPLPPDQRIHVIGFDVQDTSGSIKYIVEHGGAVLSPQESKALEKLASDRGKAWMAWTPEERTAVRATLSRLARARGTGDVSSKSNRLVLAARSLLCRLDILEAPSEMAAFEVRDAGMARMVLDVLAMDPTSRATLWAHLGHLGREYIVGQPTMGSYLAAALGAGYRVYGLLALGGSARAWDAKQEVGVIADTLRKPPPYSLEAVLASRSGGAQVTYWTFARATGEAARWLKSVHPLRTFGAVFLGDGEITDWDLESFDGAILFDTVSPTEPTPTGERRAAPKAQ